MSKEKKRLKKQSNSLAFGAGFAGGFSGIGVTTGKKGFKLGKVTKKTRIGAAIGVGSAAAGLASTIQNARGSKGGGDFIKTEFGNFGRQVGGSLLGSLTAVSLILGGKKAVALRKVAKRSSAARAARKAKSSRGGITGFIRVRGRVVPVRKKAKIVS